MAEAKTKAKKSKKVVAVSNARTVWQASSEEYARKYRPPTLNGVIGQDMAKYTIRGFVRSRKMPGAILLHGPYGNGKTTLARIIALVTNCEHLTEDGDPCLMCRPCRALIRGNTFPDYIEVNASDARGIEDMRELIKRTQFKPMTNRLVIVLDEAHEITSAGQDLLLKSLEEPKEHVMFILATTDPQKLKPTILSRCLQIRLAEMKPEKLVALLKRVVKAEKLSIKDEVLALICNKCGNHVRDALKLLEQVISAIDAGALSGKGLNVAHIEAHVSDMLGIPNYELIQSFLSNVYAGKAATALRYASECGLPKPMFLKSCIEVHGNVMLAMTTKEPKELIRDGYVLRYTSQIISGSGIKRETDMLEAMQRLSTDMISMYRDVGQFQLGDNMAPITTLTVKHTPRFRSLRGR